MEKMFERLWDACCENLENADMELNNLDCALGLAMDSRSMGREGSGLLALACSVIQNVRAMLDEASTTLKVAAQREAAQK